MEKNENRAANAMDSAEQKGTMQGNCITAETVCQMARLCYEVSTKTKADAFFSYSPHIPQMDIWIHRSGWHKGSNADEWITIRPERSTVRIRSRGNYCTIEVLERSEPENILTALLGEGGADA